MDINNLKEILQMAGVTGAGGAGFPAYAKLNTNADITEFHIKELFRFYFTDIKTFFCIASHIQEQTA